MVTLIQSELQDGSPPSRTERGRGRECNSSCSPSGGKISTSTFYFKLYHICMLMATETDTSTSLPGIFPSIKDCNDNPVSFQDRFGHAFKPLHKTVRGTEGSSWN